MGDRELLELAAKAVGGVFSPGTTRKRTGPTWETWEWCGPQGIRIGSTTTYPLTEDGDAFRLAHKLGIQIKWFGSIETVRRAIVSAAAEIGKNMP